MVPAFPRALLLLALGAGLLGCPRQIDFGPHGEITKADELIKLMSAEEAKLITLTGEGRLKLESPQGAVALTLFAAISRPNLVHLETLDFFGKPQAVMTTDGARFGLYDAQQAKFFTGPATAQNLSRFLPIVMAPEELTGLMLGDPSLLAHDEARLELDDKAGAYRLTLTRGELTQVVLVHARFLRAIRSEIRGPGVDFTAAFWDLQPIGVTGAGVLPRNLSLEAPAAQTRLELRYTEVKLNQSPDLTMFETTGPEGVEAIEVDENFQPIPPPADAPSQPGSAQ